MNLHQESIVLPLLGFVALLTVACGGSTESSSEQARPEAVESQQGATQSRETASEPSMCDLMSASEVDAALGGKLPLGQPEKLDSGCKYPILFGVDGNALAFNKLSRVNYDAYKNYENQSGVPFEYVEGLGLEAFVVNNAQVCVLLGQNESLLVGAQVIAFQEELPITQEELKAGLVEIARTMVHEL